MGCTSICYGTCQYVVLKRRITAGPEELMTVLDSRARFEACTACRACTGF